MWYFYQRHIVFQRIPPAPCLCKLFHTMVWVHMVSIAGNSLGSITLQPDDDLALLLALSSLHCKLVSCRGEVLEQSMTAEQSNL